MVQSKSIQVNLRFKQKEFEILQNYADSLYNLGKIREATVHDLIRFVVNGYANAIAVEQAKQLDALQKMKETGDFEAFKRMRYGNTSNPPPGIIPDKA
jgi:hypothetical protein